MTQTMNDLFGSDNIAINLDFASEVERLLRRIPNDNLTSEKMLYNHTLLPYYATFIPIKRVEEKE